MKKLLALAVAMGLFLPLAVGCGDDTNKAKDKAKPGATATPPAGSTAPKDKGTATPPPSTTDKKDGK